MFLTTLDLYSHHYRRQKFHRYLGHLHMDVLCISKVSFDFHQILIW